MFRRSNEKASPSTKVPDASGAASERVPESAHRSGPVRRRRSVVLSGLCLALLCSAACSELPDPPVIESRNVLRFVEAQIQIGPRPAGSDAGLKTAELIAAFAREVPGAQVSVETFSDMTPLGEKTFRNVHAFLPGKTADFVILGAHYDTKHLDSVPDFQGANDGASGVAALLAMMHAAASYTGKNGSLPIGMKFVFFDGEEALFDYGPHDGFHGSRHAASTMDLRRCKLMLVLDMIGDRDLRVQVSSRNKNLIDLALRAADEAGHADFFEHSSSRILDDHVAFENAVPSLVFIDFQYGPDNCFWHTAADTSDKITAESIKIAADSAFRLVWNIAKGARP